MTKKLPQKLSAVRQKLKTGCGNLYVILSQEEGVEPVEAFVVLGKGGGCAASQTEAIGRLVSVLLRNNIQMNEIARQLRGITCHNQNDDCSSCADAVGQALEGVDKDTREED